MEHLHILRSYFHHKQMDLENNIKKLQVIFDLDKSNPLFYILSQNHTKDCPLIVHVDYTEKQG